jgi:c-di-AMP phosphodiesterase-like protein
MIIGLEWLVVVLFASFILLWVVSLLVHTVAEKLSTVLVVLAVVCECACGVFYIGTISAQNNIEEHYVDYLKLQVQVAQYDDLDVLEQPKVVNDVITYQLWYERNKSDLENEWSFKGSSNYAKEFDFPQEFVDVLIGG